MIKITEIKELKERTCFRTDNFGNRVRDKEQIYVNRQVFTVKSGPRFVHFLIDTIVLILFFALYSFIYGILKFLLINTEIGLLFLNFIDSFSILFILFYYVFFEYKWQKTIGKYLTKTIVIDEYGNKPDFKSIMIRSFARLVPFEFISCLGDPYSYGWHDKWSNTWVVTEEELTLLKNKQLEFEENLKC